MSSSPREETKEIQESKEQETAVREPKAKEADVQETETETPAADTESDSEAQTTTQTTPWQAVYSPQFNAYYFYNSETQETTWENPLAPSSSSSGPSSSKEVTSSTDANTEASSSIPAQSTYNALQAAAIAQGIDPSLAHLDPSLAATGPGAGVAAARFNARTGQFTRADARDPSHLSEYERMKRMSEFYFDVNAWEQQRAADQEEEANEGKKRKRATKKDVERFKEQKRQKKIAKTAWLRT